MKPLDALSLPLQGKRLIEASAGTGKTYTITTLVLRLLLEKQLPLDRILIVTYTRAATAELRGRVRTRIAALHRALGSSEQSDDPALAQLVQRSRQRGDLEADRVRIERALYSTDDAAIFTIHGFCQRVLTDFAFEADAPFDWELLAQSEALVAEVAHDYWTQVTHCVDPALYARLRKVGPQGVASLIARTAHGTLPRVLPDATPAARPDDASWHAALQALRDSWPQQRSGLEAVLCDSKLNFGLKSLARDLPLLEAAFGRLDPPLDDDARRILEKLTVGLREKAAAKGKELPRHPLLDACERLYEADDALTHWLAVETIRLLSGAIYYARQELSRRTQQQDSATFDQLLTRTHDALHGPRARELRSHVRERYHAALIDEFQDTDPLQYRIFDAALQGRPMLLIGDPKQAIYGFRGADVFAYLKARDDAGEAVYTMQTNYRSDPGVIAGLNHVYAACADPFALNAIRYEQVQPRPGARDAMAGRAAVELLWTECESTQKADQVADIAQRVATDIVHTLREQLPLERERSAGPAVLDAGDIAVLCRTNKQARQVQQALSERGVPCVLHGDSSVFETPDALELERLLAAMAEPQDARALRSALAGLYIGLNAEQMDALGEDEDAWERHHADMMDVHRLWVERGFVQAVRACLRAHQVDARLLSRQDGSRRWTNLQHLIELLQEASVRERLGPAGLLRWARTMRTDLARRQEVLGQASQLRLESHENAVTLTTVHRSKGLEYPVVYVPFAWDGSLLSKEDRACPRFHALDAARTACLDLGSSELPAHQELAEQEALSEAARLLYVALTRAKHTVRVVHGPLKDAHKSALHSLLAAEAGKDAEALRASVDRLAETSGNTVTVRVLPEADALRHEAATTDQAVPRARQARRHLGHDELTTSFSALTHEQPESGPLDESIDHDAQAATLELAPVRAAEPPVTLATFPRGAAVGNVIHELLEHGDFAATEEGWTEAAAALLPARGLAENTSPTLGRGLFEALHTPLDETGLTLASLSPTQRIAELEFMFRVRPDQPLDGRALGRVLEAHGAPVALPRYAKPVGELPFAALRGYLRGFVDLVFEHQGRFYVVDYKSNDLGPQPAHYEPGRLAEAMAEHHYFLQYLLYAVALHRYLRQRVPGYDYARHFGGIYYLFVRGMAPARGPSTGVFHDRPSEALIQDLDEALGASEGDAA